MSARTALFELSAGAQQPPVHAFMIPSSWVPSSSTFPSPKNYPKKTEKLFPAKKNVFRIDIEFFRIPPLFFRFPNQLLVGVLFDSGSLFDGSNLKEFFGVHFPGPTAVTVTVTVPLPKKVPLPAPTRFHWHIVPDFRLSSESP